MDADGFAALRDLKVFVREAATKSAEVGQSALGLSRAGIVARSPESSLLKASEMRAGRRVDILGLSNRRITTVFRPSRCSTAAHPLNHEALSVL